MYKLTITFPDNTSLAKVYSNQYDALDYYSLCKNMATYADAKFTLERIENVNPDQL